MQVPLSEAGVPGGSAGGLPGRLQGGRRHRPRHRGRQGGGCPPGRWALRQHPNRLLHRQLLLL